MATEYITEKPTHKIMDIVLKIDDEYYNFEFQTGKLKERDLRRFHLYHAILADKYQTEKIRLIVIYTEKIKENISCKTKHSFFNPILFSLKNFNGDIILNNIKTKIENNEKVPIKMQSILRFYLYTKLKETKKNYYTKYV